MEGSFLVDTSTGDSRMGGFPLIWRLVFAFDKTSAPLYTHIRDSFVILIRMHSGEAGLDFCFQNISNKKI